MLDRRLTCLALFVTGVGAVCGGAPARAGNFQVSPVIVSLDEKKTSGLIEISNHGDEPIRLHVKAHAWDQSATGDMVLGATDDIIVFPTLLTLKAGETRNVRVGTRLRANGAERSFRVFVEELPPLPGARRAPGIQVRMRMGIPIFVGGGGEEPSVHVEEASSSKDGRFSFRVRNNGGAHTVTRAVDVTLLDARGHALDRRKFPGWYLLAGGERVYEARVGAVACTAARVEVRVESDRGTQISEKPVNRARCGGR